jgi:iron complex outermembrane recepter protein
VDVEAAFQMTPNWSLNAGFAWADGRVNNDDIPCRDSNFDGVGDAGAPLAAGFTGNNVIVARCKSDRSISTQPEWSLTLQSEYLHPFSNRVDGFVRGLFTYYPDNPNDNNNIVIGDYGLLNLYAGIRSHDNAWEVSLFAKNLTNTSQALSFGDVPPPTSVNLGPLGVYDIPVNYRSVTYVQRREFGLNVRFTFGSR